ncbi:snare domain-containing protein [Ophiostoma piceae UAMH 11346]|uniref:Snare domain-containing protein n=1 Tax=Ophiostoma piceae (strain UAMH 11346) TaxID=1262450 RepID=S3CA79_OPHP1|nr:snare domain-containing protein [Ophiostoma piceae UAMH 11346]
MFGLAWRKQHASNDDESDLDRMMHAYEVLADKLKVQSKFSRFGNSNLHQRDPRSALFEGYTGPGAESSRRTMNASPSRFGNGTPGGSPNGGYGYGYPSGQQSNGFRSATPNRNDAVLNELESQNDAHIEGILGKVRILKDMTVAIGDEIRDSSALAEKMNDTFDATRVRLRGTMNRMLLMAERTGVGWRVHGTALRKQHDTRNTLRTTHITQHATRHDDTWHITAFS